MSEYPQDIMTAAEIALCNSLCHDVDAYGGSYEDSRLAAIKDIAAAILAERERHDWQPISQVNPVDGLIVVGYGEYRERDGFSPAFMRWYDSVAGWSVNGMPFYPTHFKPLPSPPQP